MNAWPADSVERRPIGALLAYDKNARMHDEEQVGQIAASMREWGFTMPVLVSESGVVIAGHGRLLAARRLGLTEVPVMVARGWTERQIKAYRIADNRLAELAAWNVPLLAAELGELAGMEQLVGFAAGDLEALLRGDQTRRPPPTLTEARATLAERFGAAPFSVLNAREGWWQDRKRAWIGLGIESEIGRGEAGGSKKANGKSAARTFGQDLMRGEHIVGRTR